MDRYVGITIISVKNTGYLFFNVTVLNYSYMANL